MSDAYVITKMVECGIQYTKKEVKKIKIKLVHYFYTTFW